MERCWRGIIKTNIKAAAAVVKQQNLKGLKSILIMVRIGVLGGAPVELSMSQGWQFFGAAMPMAIAGLVSGICQGKAAVGAIHMTGKQPDASGKGITMTALVETYAILALLASILVLFGIQL